MGNDSPRPQPARTAERSRRGMFVMRDGSTRPNTPSHDVLVQVLGWGVPPCLVVLGSGKDKTKDRPENGCVWPVWRQIVGVLIDHSIH